MRRRTALLPLVIVLLVGALSGAEGHARADASTSAAAPNELDRLLARTDGEEQSLKIEMVDLGPRLDLVRRRMRARGRAYYRLIRAGLLPAGGGFDALVDHAAHVERSRMALERDVAAEATLMRRTTEIDARLSKLRVDRAPLELQREAMSRARLALQETDERRSAFARAFETSQRPDSVAIYGADLGPIDTDARSGFRALKGRLPFPIAGRAEVRRVNHPGAGGPGVELVASIGAPVRSVAPGRVAFADTYDDHGITVILDHGDHYYSVYSNLGSAEVRTGESVSSGGRIGVVGAGNGHGAALYFELRHNAATLDPSPWLGL